MAAAGGAWKSGNFVAEFERARLAKKAALPIERTVTEQVLSAGFSPGFSRATGRIKRLEAEEREFKNASNMKRGTYGYRTTWNEVLFDNSKFERKTRLLKAISRGRFGLGPRG